MMKQVVDMRFMLGTGNNFFFLCPSNSTFVCIDDHHTISLFKYNLMSFLVSI